MLSIRSKYLWYCLLAISLNFIFLPVLEAAGTGPYTNLGLYGGHIEDIAIDQSNPNRVFSSSYIGDGLFVTTDAGANWQAVETSSQLAGEDEFKNHAVYAVKIAPSNPQVVVTANQLWVETSTDGGSTWTHTLNSTMQRDCAGCGGSGDDFRYTMSVAIDPADSQTFYVGAGGPSNTYIGGAIYKTRDGGATWEKMNNGANFDFAVVDMDVDPQNPDIVWAVTSSEGTDPNCAAYGGYNGSLYRSSDGGGTWNVIYTYFSSFNYCVSDQTVAAKPNDSNTVFTGGGLGIIKLSFNGTSWVPTFPVISGSGFVQDIEFDPQDSDTLYTTWLNPTSFGGDGIGKVARSTDGGTTWEIYPHNYSFTSLAVDPSNSEILYAGEFNNGMFKSQDHGQTWSPVNTGINAIKVYDVANDPNDTAHLLAATVIGVYERKSAQASWVRLLPYMARSVQFDPVDSQTYYAGLQGYLDKTVDGGQNWTLSNQLTATDPYGYNYVNDITVDANNTSVIYIAVGGFGSYGEIDKSSDGGATFAKILDGQNQAAQKYDFNSVVIDPADSQHLFAGGGNYYAPKVDGDLWVSMDGGANWSRTSLTNVIVNALLIDPQNPNVLYAGTGYSGGTDTPLFKSSDSGVTWNPSYNGIPDPAVGLRGIWGASKTEVFAVALYGVVLHYDGSSWSTVNSGTTESLYGVWGASASDVFSVGADGTILHYDGNTWNAMSSGTTKSLNSVWGTSENDVFAVGVDGTILHYDGNAWNAMSSGTTKGLNAVGGNSATDVFAIGNGGTILHYDGSTWTAMNSGTTKSLNSVWGTSANDVFAVGEGGTILHYDGGAWNEMSSGSTNILYSVWGGSANDVFAVGSIGTILHYDGNAWNEMSSGTTDLLHGVWGTSTTNAFVVGGAGNISGYDGNKWSVLRPSGSALNSVTDLAFYHGNTNYLYAGTTHSGVYVSPNGGQNWLNLGTPKYDVNAIVTGSLYSATEGGMLQLTGTGLIYGTITDAASGQNVDGAVVFTDGGAKSISVNSEYFMVSPTGIFELTSVADNFANKTVNNVVVAGGDVTTASIAMDSGVPDRTVLKSGNSNLTGVKNDYCFIATAAYGSLLEKHVKILRRFRDQFLLPYSIGRKLVAFYYKRGKPLAEYMDLHPWIKQPVRVVLYPIVGFAWLLLTYTTTMMVAICTAIVLLVVLIARRRYLSSRNSLAVARSGIFTISVLIAFSLLTGNDNANAATIFQQVGIASSPNPVGSGARALGMGGAFIAIADDATAASWNPAGLIQLESPEMSVVAAYNDRNEKYSSQSHPEINNTGGINESNINYFSVSHPFRLLNRNMVASINYQRLYDYNRHLHYQYDYSSTGVNLLQDKNFSQDGAVGAMGLATAVQITPQVSAGVSFNIWTDELFWSNGWTESYIEQGVGTQGGTPVTVNTSITDKYSQFRGVNANLGLLWNVNNMFTLGAVIKTPFTATMHHKFNFSTSSIFGAPVSTTVSSQQAITENVKLRLPLSYGIGLGIRVSDSLTYDVDLYRTEWSKYILTDSQGNKFSPIDGQLESASNVKNTTQARFGVEYLIIKRTYVVPLRGGIFYDPEPSQGNVKDFYGISLGSGIVYQRYVFDIAYQYRRGRKVDTGNLIATSTADIGQHQLLASLIVHY